MIDDHVVTELFKLWIEKNPNKFLEPSPEDTIVAWDDFKKRLMAKWSKDHPTKAYSEGI